MTRVILDCDPGHDDAVALLLALASPELELLGVTTVSGSQMLEKTTANAIRVPDHLGRPAQRASERGRSDCSALTTVTTGRVLTPPRPPRAA
jgi:inosine-uridine nucleoside N-ribohydrolase